MKPTTYNFVQGKLGTGSQFLYYKELLKSLNEHKGANKK